MSPIPPRAIVFIDGSNIFKAFKSIRENELGDLDGKLRWSPVQLVDILAKPYQLAQKRYYGSINSFDPRVATKQGRFYAYLRHKGFETVVMDLKMIGGQHKEKGVDGSINVDMNELARDDAYDVAILVAADGDFTEPGVKRVQERYKRQVVNAAFRSRTAFGLRAACNDFVPLDSLAFVYYEADRLTFHSLDAIRSTVKKNRPGNPAIN